MARSYRGHQKLDVSRGDLVTVALQGDFGKPRPALVIQSDVFHALPSITVLPVTGDLRDVALIRVRLTPDDINGLDKTSDIMVDKPQSIARERIGSVIGRLTQDQMQPVNRALAEFLGIN